MIIVVEGISAAGKSTYAQRFGADHWVPEFETSGSEPGRGTPIEEHARFWLEHNIRRFARAVEVEARHGFAICDTEPLKCHFDWCCARAGQVSMDLFDAAIPLIRQAIMEQRIGFGDRYLVKKIAPEIARAQKEGDPTRSRRNFDKHLALQPHLIDWFETLSDVLPGRVAFAFPDQNQLEHELKTKAPEANPRRFDVSVFDALIERLPK